MKAVILLRIFKHLFNSVLLLSFSPEIPRETPFIWNETGKCVFNMREYVVLLPCCKIGENGCVPGTRREPLLPFMKLLKLPKF